MFNLITVGDIVIDTHVQIDDANLQCKIKNKPCQLCLDFATKIPIRDSFQSLGGNASNVAVGAVKLGLKSAIISSIGNDPNGRLALDELIKFNVDIEHVIVKDKKQTRYSVVLNFKGERTILAYHGKRNYIWPSKMPATDWLYYTGLSMGFKKIKKNMLVWLKKHPTVRLAFNPGSYQLKNHLDEVKETIAISEILIVNTQEAEHILQTSLKEVKNMTALLRQLVGLGAKEVVITDSAKGAYVGSLDEVWYMPSYPAKVVAKTGAGDAFSSGYVSARCYGYNRPQALRWGIANSCGVITQVGAQNGLLNKKTIIKTIERYSDIKPKPIF
ncbi:MAG: carbohydrate kinase family protein [bacterium]